MPTPTRLCLDGCPDAWTDTYESDPYIWGNIGSFRLEPASMWAYASHPQDFPAT